VNPEVDKPNPGQEGENRKKETWCTTSPLFGAVDLHLGYKARGWRAYPYAGDAGLLMRSQCERPLGPTQSLRNCRAGPQYAVWPGTTAAGSPTLLLSLVGPFPTWETTRWRGSAAAAICTSSIVRASAPFSGPLHPRHFKAGS